MILKGSLVEAAVLEQHEKVDGHARVVSNGKHNPRPISPAERRILGLAVKGLTDKEICRELGLSITTVRTHWTRLRRKLNVVNRAQAIAESMELESGAQLKLLQARIKAMHRSLNQKGLAVWEWHPESDSIIADELSMKMLNAMSEGEQMSLVEFLKSVPPEDRALLSEHLRDGRVHSAEGICHRVKLPSTRQIQVRTKITRVATDDRPIVICTTETMI